MLLLRIDEHSRTPAYRQILDGIKEKVASGAVRPGEKLPSTRRLADNLGLHRSTVALAYQELWSLGFVDLHPGARPKVRERTLLASQSSGAQPGLVDWSALMSSAAWDALRRYRDLQGGQGAEARISFKTLDMDRRLLPVEPFRGCLRRVLATEGASLLSYGDPSGYPPLREYVAERLQRHGIAVASHQIILTNGSQHGIDLLLRVIAAPGRSVAVESPTYDSLLPLLRLHGMKPLEIPLRPEGMDLTALERVLRRERPLLVYTMPSFQNPTGACTSQAHREKLLALCEEHRVPILEDGFEEEMKYTGKAVLPLKSMDRHGVVVYCGTFSKVLFPGIRIGWLAADPACVERVLAIRRFSELAPSAVLQAAMHEFCRNGWYDRHVGRMHRAFRKRMQVAVSALRQQVRPEWAEWTEPRGGYLIWLKLKPLPNGTDLEALLASHGVQATQGRSFFCSAKRDSYLRLSISTLSEDEIAEGVARLSRALRAAHATPSSGGVRRRRRT